MAHEKEVAGFFRLSPRRPSPPKSPSRSASGCSSIGRSSSLSSAIDGVPWNNNCAENAIKRFAYYREDTVGTMTEAGLNDYLVLLSIYQTCRYKGVSFLKFLLSQGAGPGRLLRKEAPEAAAALDRGLP